MQQTITIPNWVYQAYSFTKHNWTTVAGVVVVAIIASIVVEVSIRHYKSKKEIVSPNDIAKLKKFIAWLLVIFSTLFSWLSYVIFFAQTNAGVLQAIPIIGSHSAEAVGTAYVLYQLRLNKYYKAFAIWASKWTGKKTTAPVVVQPVESQAPAEPAENFLAS